MAVYISRKSSWIRFLVSFLPAAGVAFLLMIFLSGPRLGILYDLLLTQRSPMVSREILLIDSSTPGDVFGRDILEPGAATSILYTMTELGAQSLIIQIPILGMPVGGMAGEAEILHRFDEEFSLLSGNIRNLFDAIRTGSIAPADAARYVGMLVELSEMGKERLLDDLIRRDEESITRMENAALFFGNVRRPGDLRVQLIMAGGGGQPGLLAQTYEYSLPQPDRDGVLRRVAPVLTVPYISDEVVGEMHLKHIVYGALSYRIEPYSIYSILPHDLGGSVLFEIPRGEGFRRVSILDFLAYEEADRELRRLIQEGEALGIFQNIDGENRPDFLYDFALQLRSAGAAHRQSWIMFRNQYFESINNFLQGPTELNMIRSLEELIVSLEPGDGVNQLLAMRDNLMLFFSTLRRAHSEVIDLRQRLEDSLFDSFSILGDMAYIEASALLANSIITRQAISVGDERYLLIGALISALLTCFLIKSLSPFLTIGAGLLLSLFFGVIFSAVFIFSGFWFDPQIPAAASGTGALASFIWAVVAKTRYSRRFQIAYGNIVSRTCLKSVMQEGRPEPSQSTTIKAAVVAIKNFNPSAQEDSPDHESLSKQAISFQKKAAEMVKKVGGTIIGTEGDLVTACFGSPLERVHRTGKETPSPYEDSMNAQVAMALYAVDFVTDIAKNPDYDFWQFGVHMGNCTFAWTPLSGYFALGLPVQRSKILARLTGRYRSRILISASVNAALPELVGKKLGILKENDGSQSENFYKLADK